MHDSSTVITFSKNSDHHERNQRISVTSSHVCFVLVNQYLRVQLLTVVCGQFKCSDIIHTKMYGQSLKGFTFTKFLSFLIVEERRECLSSSICCVPLWNNLCHSNTLYEPLVPSVYVVLVISWVSLAVLSSLM